MADGRCFGERKIEKSPHLSKGLTDCQEVLRDYAYIGPLNLPTVKLRFFLKSKMADDRHFEQVFSSS